MKNFSLRKAAAVLLLLSAAGHVSAHALELRIPLRLNHIQVQPQTIGGTVSDARGPLPGVTVAVKGETILTTTDALGNFSINAQPGETLVFSFVGYKSAEITLGSNTSLKILLEEDVTSLQDVVVNAGYYTVKEKERTGSIAKITAKDIENQPVTHVLAAMQGRMAGVNIVQNTGTPGGGFDIIIRGLNSLRNDANAPLYIIDGVPYSSETIGSGYTSTPFPRSTSPLNSLNPESIAGIEVLKDADATAIYGSRGANGVVLITTKKGKAGKTEFQFSASQGTGRVTRFLDLMNTRQYLAMRAQAFENDNVATYPASAYDINGTWDQNRYTDWQEKLIGGTAEISDLQGTVSGGSEKTQFIMGGNYHYETTVFIGDFSYRKGGAFANLSHRSDDDRFKLNFAANYVAQNNRIPSMDMTRTARQLAPNAPALYTEDGALNWENSTWTNPLSYDLATFKARTADLIGNTFMSYALLPGLDAKMSLGYTNTQHLETRINPSTMFDPAYNLGPDNSALFVNTTNRRSWIVEPQLGYVFNLGNSKFDLLAGSSFQQNVSNQNTEYGVGFSSNNLIYNLASATFKDIVLTEETVYKYQAFFGRINYNYKGRYLLNLTGRRDGSSRFGPGNQFATFGAVGAAWVFSEEKFFKDNHLLSFGKLRGSYGSTGSDNIGDYQFLDTYTSAGGSYQGAVGLQPSRLFNPDFGWEVNKKLEAALELGFFDDRLNISAAWYRNRSSNQLTGIPLPATTGFTSIQANLNATVENTGWEFGLQTTNVKATDFKWTTSANLTLARNTLVAFPNLAGSTYANRYRIGQPLNIALVYHYTGIDPQTGLYTFEDVDGDGQITAPNDKQTVVDLNPEFYGGLQNTISYKGWTLDFLFQFVKQKNYGSSLGAPGLMSNQPVQAVNAWGQPGDSGPYQLYTSGLNQPVLNAQTRFDSSNALIVDASYIRLKNISLSYELPLRFAAKCRLTAMAQNLLTITPYDYGDPEFANAGFLPPLRIMSFGVQLSL